LGCGEHERARYEIQSLQFLPRPNGNWALIGNDLTGTGALKRFNMRKKTGANLNKVTNKELNWNFPKSEPG